VGAGERFWCRRRVAAAAAAAVAAECGSGVPTSRIVTPPLSALGQVWEEAYANVMREPFASDALMAKSDCTGAGEALCHEQHIHAFPTVTTLETTPSSCEHLARTPPQRPPSPTVFCEPRPSALVHRTTMPTPSHEP